MHQLAFDRGLHRISARAPRPEYDFPRFASAEDALANLRPEGPVCAIYDAVVVDRAATFVERFPGITMYAVKANPNQAVLPLLWQAGVRDFDIASLSEAHLIRRLFPAARMYFMHPVKSRRAISETWALGVRDFACDSLAELDKIATSVADTSDLGIFVRLAVNGSAAAYDLSGKFGCDHDEGLALLRRARALAPRLGVTFHVGSQCMEPAAYVRAIEYVAELVREAGVEIDHLDVGGGFPVPYPGMPVPDQGAYFDAIEAAIGAAGLSGLSVMAEPGRALVAEGGSTLARIELVRGGNIFINDGVFGSLFDAGRPAWQFPIRLICSDGRPVGGEKRAFRFFGPTCDSLDVMEGPFMLPGDAREGDWIEVGTLGAYGQAMASGFNGFHAEETVYIAGASFAVVGGNEMIEETQNG